MQNKLIPKRTLLLWQIRAILIGGLLVAVCRFFSQRLNILNQISFIIAIITLIIAVWYLPVFFKKYEIILKEEAIIINYGVIIKFCHIMPFPRLIYAQSFASPLARLLGVSALSLKAARSSLIIPEIEKQAVDSIINYLASEEKDGQKI